MKYLNRLIKYGEVVMFSHTLFSLPFALIALFLASDGVPDIEVFVWSMLALISGRNGANAINRVIDKEIDKKNPRTANRHIPKGDIKSIEIIMLTIFCFMVFEISAYMLNTLCFILSPLALLLFIAYSYTKRYTWLCHLILGITCAGAPVGAWIAVTGQFALTPFIIGGIVALWVAGFDIIYGTQDINFDRENGIYSIPARFGFRNSLYISRFFHFVMIILLLTLYIIENLGTAYIIGIVLASILLVIEHYIVDPDNKKKMNLASYNINQIVSMLILIFTLFDIVY